MHVMEDASGEHSHWVLIGQGMTSTELSGLLASLFELDVATAQAVGVLRPTEGGEVRTNVLFNLSNSESHLPQV
jgi:hypothetical protein